jgi:hypothetical protein
MNHVAKSRVLVFQPGVEYDVQDLVNLDLHANWRKPIVIAIAYTTSYYTSYLKIPSK